MNTPPSFDSRCITCGQELHKPTATHVYVPMAFLTIIEDADPRATWSATDFEVSELILDYLETRGWVQPFILAARVHVSVADVKRIAARLAEIGNLELGFRGVRLIG